MTLGEAVDTAVTVEISRRAEVDFGDECVPINFGLAGSAAEFMILKQSEEGLIVGYSGIGTEGFHTLVIQAILTDISDSPSQDFRIDVEVLPKPQDFQIDVEVLSNPSTESEEDLEEEEAGETDSDAEVSAPRFASSLQSRQSTIGDQEWR